MKALRIYTSRTNIRQHSLFPKKSYVSWSQGARRLHFGVRDQICPFSPPEDWHEPVEDGSKYTIIAQSSGEGYRHILSAKQIHERLSQVPQEFLDGLEVIQLSQMTRKKRSFPCYGMQWGQALYLYPLEESLEEIFYSPPKPNVINESKMFGGRWDQPEVGVWRLTWTEVAIQDFYLNNILIHELGHLVDNRNSNYTDRERFAEWFAIEYGYRASGGRKARRPAVKRRHHSC